MMKTAMKLETHRPEYLEARIDAEEARTLLRRVRSRLGMMVSANDSHGQEVAVKERSGLRLATNGQVHRRGGGSGFEVIYSRCRCDGFNVECDHDPRESPHSETDLEAAEAAIVQAETRLAAAETRLASIEPTSFDCLAAARRDGHMYVWWPQDQGRDPRKYRWRGQAVSDIDVVALGAHELRRMLTAGAIVEVG